MPDARCTRSLACEMEKHTSVVTTGSPEQTDIPCTVVYGLCRALLGEPRSVATVASGMNPLT